MRTTKVAAPPAAHADDGAEVAKPADDRLVGAEAIGAWMGTSKRVAIWNMEAGRWPHWREGAKYVASRRALSDFWREATAQKRPARSPMNPRWESSPFRRGARVEAA